MRSRANLRKVPLGLATAIVTLVCAACGPSQPLHGAVPPTAISGSVHASSSASPSTKPTATPLVTAAGYNSAWDAQYPPTGETYNNASVAVKTVWQKENIQILPGRNLFAAMPPVSTKLNYDPALSTVQFQQLVWANQRASALYQWAELTDQFGFLQNLVGSQLTQGPTAVAMGQGYSVHDPNCDIFPEGVAIFPLTAQTRSFLLQNNPSVASSDNIALVEELNGGSSCSAIGVKQGASNENLGSISGTVVDIIAGYQVDDPVLGPIFYGDVASQCISPGAPPALCNVFSSATA